MPYALLALALLAADPAAPPAADAVRFDGTWLFDDLRRSARTQDAELMIVWESPVTVSGGGFTVKKFLGGEADYRGKFTFDPKQPTHVDLAVEGFDLNPLGMPAKIAAGARPGVFSLDGDTLRIAFSADPSGERPKAADGKDAKDGKDSLTMRAVLKRAPAKFTALPKEVRVTVTGPDGKPTKGVQLAEHANFGTNQPPETNNRLA